MTESTKARHLSDMPRTASTASVRNPAAPARLNQRRALSHDCCLNVCMGIIASELRRRGSSCKEELDLAFDVVVDVAHQALGTAWRGARAARDVSSPARDVSSPARAPTRPSAALANPFPPLWRSANAGGCDARGPLSLRWQRTCIQKSEHMWSRRTVKFFSAKTSARAMQRCAKMRSALQTVPECPA